MNRGLLTRALFMSFVSIMMAGFTVTASAYEQDVQNRERIEERGDENQDRAERRRTRYLENRQLLEQVMTARLSRELGLGDEQTVLLVRHISELRQQSHQRGRQHVGLMRELREAISEKGEDTAIEATVNALIALDKEEAARPHIAESLAGKELTVWQRARLYLFMEDFDDEMREIFDRIRRTRRGHPDRGDEDRPDEDPDERDEQ